MMNTPTKCILIILACFGIVLFSIYKITELVGEKIPAHCDVSVTLCKDECTRHALLMDNRNN